MKTSNKIFMVDKVGISNENRISKGMAGAQLRTLLKEYENGGPIVVIDPQFEQKDSVESFEN